MPYNIDIDGKQYRLQLDRHDGSNWGCRIDDKHTSLDVDARLIRPNVLSLVVGDSVYEIRRDPSNIQMRGAQMRLWIRNAAYLAEVRDPRALQSRSRSSAAAGSSRLISSMPGKVIRVLVQQNQTVEKGQALVVVEAMKMQNEIRSPGKGVISQLVEEGIYVNPGEVLAIVEPTT